jgi:hypothetical protein
MTSRGRKQGGEKEKKRKEKALNLININAGNYLHIALQQFK